METISASNGRPKVFLYALLAVCFLMVAVAGWRIANNQRTRSQQEQRFNEELGLIFVGKYIATTAKGGTVDEGIQAILEYGRTRSFATNKVDKPYGPEFAVGQHYTLTTNGLYKTQFFFVPFERGVVVRFGDAYAVMATKEGANYLQH